MEIQMKELIDAYQCRVRASIAVNRMQVMAFQTSVVVVDVDDDDDDLQVYRSHL